MLAIRLLLVLLFGYLGYRESAKFARQTGRAPWGLPPWAWALIVGASLLIGGLLLIIARRTSAKTPSVPVGAAAGWGAAPMPPAGPAGPSFDWSGPAPEPADVWAAPAPVPAAPLALPLPPVATPAESPVAVVPAPAAPVAPVAPVGPAPVSAPPTFSPSRDILPGR